MLYLNPPYFMINGISVFPDHADRNQYYYLPMMPHLSTSKDANGADMPTIQLIEYEGAAGTGGFIDFDVNLGISSDVLNEVAQKVQQEAKLTDPVRLSPVTFIDGSVKLLILGAESPSPTPAAGGAPAPAATPAARGPRFVIKVQNATKPSLFGDNQATFSVQLDQDGATILEQALHGQMVPIAVIYSLDFVGLRPAFRVHLHVDWDRVQTHIEDDFHAGFLFVSSDIEKAVDKLIEQQVITLNVDTFVTDADGGKASAGDRDRAVAEVYEMIKNTFFESSLPPMDPNKPTDLSQGIAAANAISELAVTGGWSSIASFSRKQVDLSRTDRKVLDVNISERTSVQRTIYPQGHLSGLLATLTKSGVSPDRFIVKVDLDNPWFQRRKVDVVSHADFDIDAIDSIDVTMSYNGSTKSVSLTKEAPRGSVDWSSQLQNGRMVRPVTYSYVVNFAGVDTTQRPGQLTTGILTENGDTIGIQPRSQLFAATTIPIRADGFRFDRYPTVEVAVRYDDDANHIHQNASFLLTSQAPEALWQQFMIDTTKRAFSYRLTYSLAAGTTTITPWLTAADGKIDIADPFPAKSSLMVIPAVDWTTSAQVLVQLAYPSFGNPVAQQSYIFTQANSAAQSFLADRQDPTQTSISFEVRIIGRNGSVWTVPKSVTTDSFLTIQPGMKGHQIVTIRPEQVDFAGAHVTDADIHVRYADPAHQLSAAATFKIAAQTDIQHFAYDYLDASVSPEFSADIHLDNGQTKSFDWSPVSDNAVTIVLSNLV